MFSIIERLHAIVEQVTFMDNHGSKSKKSIFLHLSGYSRTYWSALCNNLFNTRIMHFFPFVLLLYGALKLHIFY